MDNVLENLGGSCSAPWKSEFSLFGNISADKYGGIELNTHEFALRETENG